MFYQRNPSLQTQMSVPEFGGTSILLVLWRSRREKLDVLNGNAYPPGAVDLPHYPPRNNRQVQSLYYGNFRMAYRV